MKNASLAFGILLVFIVSFFSCGTDDSDSSTGDSFFDGVLTSATNQQLHGRWAIFQIEFEGQTSDVPVSFIECGRDFFDFQLSGIYNEYIFNDNFECTPEINMATWSLSEGVITTTNGVETDQWVITELTSNRLVFKFRLDANSDGQIEVYKAICNRYDPPMEMDIYSSSFYWDSTTDNLDKITLKYNIYSGYNQFEKYEIYRLNANCNLQDPQLIATITDINQTIFIDENPTPWSEICYVFKIYTNEGLLGESSPVRVDTNSIEVPNINLSEPTLNNGIVELNWEAYQGYYFSHYEIEARNFSSGSGGGYQSQVLTTINDISTTSNTTELPCFSNPVFVIYAYNIFGNRSQTTIEGQNQRSTNFSRNDILPINTIRFSAFSPDETILYYSDYSTLYRYNYNTNTVENSTEINSSSIIFLTVFESSFGTEVIMNTGGSIKVYDADLNFKYNLNTGSNFPEHLAYNENGYWLGTDRENLYSFSRTENNLNLISESSLYNESFCCSRINVLDIKQDRILIGNHTKPQGLLIEINANGELSNTMTTQLRLTSEWKNNALFSEDEDYVLNIEDNTLFSTDSNNLITTLNQNFFPTGISTNGMSILGTNNNPDSNEVNFHEKKVRVLSYPSLNEQLYEAKGYPHLVFQNHLGQIVSVSKGLIGSIDSSTPENDIFIEIIEL